MLLVSGEKLRVGGGGEGVSAICVGLKKTRNYIQYFLNWVLFTLLYMLFAKLSCVYLCQLHGPCEHCC
jgi:hypothetical protein